MYFSCHGPGGDAFLYWSHLMKNSTPVYIGESAMARPSIDTGENMLFISGYSFTHGGRMDEIELYASRADDTFQVSTWREMGHLKYRKVSAVIVSINKGYNKIMLNDTIAVAPGDVLGWYSKKQNPIVYGPATSDVVVRRAYQHRKSYFVRGADMAGQENGWERAYSLRVRVRRQIGDYWETSQPVAGLDECSITLLLDDNIMMNCRTFRHARAQLFWHANGTLLSPVEYPSGLIDPNCQGSLVSFGSVLYLSQDACLSNRHSLTVKRSVDNGHTWTTDRILWAGPSGYSQLISWGRHIGVLFEHGDKVTPERISFVRWKASAKMLQRRAAAMNSQQHQNGNV